MIRPAATFFVSLLSLSFTPAALSQLNARAVDNFAAQVSRGDLGKALAEARSECRVMLDAIRSFPARTSLEARQIAIDRARNCVEEFRRTGISNARDIQTSTVITEVFRPDTMEVKEAQDKNDAAFTFKDVRFGVGFGFSVSESEAVSDAEIVNGVVRVKSSSKEQPRVIFEFHKYFWCNKDNPATRGCGPFVAVASSDSKVISGVGMGFMYGWRKEGTDPDGFSIGVGAILDSKVKDLADGFEENQPPPPGESTVRYTEKSRWSLIIFATKTF